MVNGELLMHREIGDGYVCWRFIYGFDLMNISSKNMGYVVLCNDYRTNCREM